MIGRGVDRDGLYRSVRGREVRNAAEETVASGFISGMEQGSWSVSNRDLLGGLGYDQGSRC